MARRHVARVRLAVLLHDAAEAYIGDMARPLKAMMPEFEEVERRVWQAIACKFRLPVAMPAVVKRADNLALACEREIAWDNPPDWKFPETPEDPRAWDFMYASTPNMIADRFEVRARHLHDWVLATL